MEPHEAEKTPERPSSIASSSTGSWILSPSGLTPDWANKLSPKSKPLAAPSSGASSSSWMLSPSGFTPVKYKYISPKEPEKKILKPHGRIPFYQKFPDIVSSAKRCIEAAGFKTMTYWKCSTFKYVALLLLTQ